MVLHRCHLWATPYPHLRRQRSLYDRSTTEVEWLYIDIIIVVQLPSPWFAQPTNIFAIYSQLKWNDFTPTQLYNAHPPWFTSSTSIFTLFVTVVDEHFHAIRNCNGRIHTMVAQLSSWFTPAMNTFTFYSRLKWKVFASVKLCNSSLKLKFASTTAFKTQVEWFHTNMPEQLFSIQATMSTLHTPSTTSHHYITVQLTNNELFHDLPTTEMEWLYRALYNSPADTHTYKITLFHNWSGQVFGFKVSLQV